MSPRREPQAEPPPPPDAAMLFALLACLMPPDASIDYEGSLNARLGKGVTPDTNAAVGLLKALGPAPDGQPRPDAYYALLGVKRPPDEGDYLVKLGAYAKNHLKPEQVNAFFDQSYEAAKRPWKAGDNPHLAAWLKANDKPLAAVTEAVRRPHYFNPRLAPMVEGKRGDLAGAMPPVASECRDFASALTIRAAVRLGEGKPNEAWADLMTCQRLAAHVANGGTVFESLVGYAVHSVACSGVATFAEHADLSAAELLAKLKEFDALPQLPPAGRAIDAGERYGGLDVFQNMARAGGGVAPDDWKAVSAWAGECYDRMASAANIADRPKRLDAFKALVQQLRDAKREEAGVPAKRAEALKFADILIGMVVPAVEKSLDARDRTTQQRDVVRVALALAAFKADAKQYPAALGELAPKYIAAVPADLFSGAALHYKRDGAGYALHGVGPNGRDDGGRTRADVPPGDDVAVKVKPVEPNK